MIRRVTRWVSDYGIGVLFDGKSHVAVTPEMSHQSRIGDFYNPNPITIEYEDGKPAPQPATRERVVEGFISQGDMYGTSQDPTMRLLSLKEDWCYTIPARLIITEPVVEMTLLEAVEHYRDNPGPRSVQMWIDVLNAAARERAKVGN